ncbi:MAG: TonB-dependent receptor [Rhodospirillales bacterium]|nr:TonB-dependent receptor [Rhodospirillales bacterium]
MDWDRSDTGNIWAELRYASNDIDRDVSPSFPVLNTPIVPAYHPGNPFGEDVFFQGRPYGYGQPPEVNFYEHDTARLSAGIEGRFTDTASWNVSMVRAQNDTLQNPHDVVVANFQAALLGFGGSDCNANPLDAGPEQAGAGGCLFFNPFSSSFAAGPGEALHNSPALRPFIIGDYFGDGRSQLTTLEANVTGFLPWRDAGYAAGVQYRDQSLDFAYDEITRNDGFAFLIGNPDFSAADRVGAAYGEIWLPLSETLDVTGALRYEGYGEGVGDTLDPKVTLLYRATGNVSIRGSYSTSFRAPSPFQTRGARRRGCNGCRTRPFDTRSSIRRRHGHARSPAAGSPGSRHGAATTASPFRRICACGTTC